MTKFAIAVLAAATLVLPALSIAGDKPTDSRAKPSSFVPHPHTKTHVYGSPIQSAVGHAKTSHHKYTPKKRSSSAANRDAH